MAGSFVGLSVRSPDRLPADAAGALRETLAQRGVRPGNDGDLLWQYFGLNLDPSEKANVLRDQPALRRFLDERTRLEGERFERPRGRELTAAYNADVLALRNARDAALRRLETLGLTGNDYRAARREVLGEYAGSRRGLQLAHFGTLDPARVDAALDAAYRQRGEASPEERALDGLYTIRPEGPDPESRDRFFAERRAYLDSLSPELRQKLLDRQLAAAPTETERAYVLAQRAYDTWSRIPKYLGGITNERAYAAEAVLDRARARRRQQPGLSLFAAIVMDQGDAQAKYDALGLDQGRYRRNPLRRQAFQRSPLLAAFYGELVLEEVDAVAQAGAGAVQGVTALQPVAVNPRAGAGQATVAAAER